MTFRTILIGGAGLAALATAAPSAGQYYNGYSGYNAYNNGYSAYGNNRYSGYGMNTTAATSQCTAAVQQRLYYRNTNGVGGIIGSLLGMNLGSNARVLNITRVTPTSTGVRVRGLATTGRTAYNSYGAYGVGAYGALGYSGYNPDLSFKCDVDYRGYVRDIDINRR
jgi:hypothetical protein